MTTCTCPLHTREGHIERAALDVHCPVHGARAQPLPHCPTCTCGVGSKIVQEQKVAAQAALKAAADSPEERHD